ncbi:laminin subunit gamma-2-like [Oncorhynchus keta]|uniref:laminin subunit gamma-2-like n=1 Tax=Oncorhynchus keta TaxID=8018 RepID=UPI0015FD16C4|nr:laminin subunit gamma-2-like [Oncorhynchus keta]
MRLLMYLIPIRVSATMKSSWIFLCGLSLCTWLSVQGTYSYGGSDICKCNGKSRYCLPDSGGLHCVDCQDNTEGRHCERCKEGFHHQRAGNRCLPCNCSRIGSVGSHCDSRGHCSCRVGAQGDKCDRCPNGTPISSNGCANSGQLTDNSVTAQSLPCFCYGHSTQCSPAKGYSVHTITSTFDNGPEGWRAATAHGVTPSQVHFRWSPTHKDVEVISKDIMPAYLYAPDSYLGNQELSYGQNISFSLRLDRGVRHPSTADVVLEGSGLRVAASLGDLRTIVPCGQKITYTFRLDEQRSSKWRPLLSSFQFQKLLQNLTAIKIRGTFGENGRGYLDNVRMESARQGAGTPAAWVQNCNCPVGYKGQFCERCASGYKRSSPSKGPYSSCEPCSCRGGSCDSETGDCYSADETPGRQTCQLGYYNDPAQPQSCLKCPCPNGAACSVSPGTVKVKCDLCPPGTTGSLCDTCQDGFYGNPLGENGVQRPCRRCQCNGVSSCDPQTGECLKCLNHTTGFFCESCLDGYHHSMPSEACKPCGCNSQGSLYNKCGDQGQCSCREGFEGLKCQRSACPSCFNPVKTKVEGYTRKLREIETLFTGTESGSLPVNDAQMERAIRAAEDIVTDLQRNAQTLSESEKDLQARLSDISTTQLSEGRDIQAISYTINNIKLQDQRYQRQVSDIQTLIHDVRRKLEEARLNIKQAEFPLSDAEVDTDSLSTLVQRATGLAEKHQSKAATVEKTANSALAESEKSLALMRTVMTGENKIRELIGDLKTKYDKNSAQVKAMESLATRLSSSAQDESRMAADTLEQIASLELNIPGPLKDIDSVAAKLDGLSEQVEENLTEYQALQEETQEDKAAVEDLLALGKAAQQEYYQLLARANAAKADTELALKAITDNIDGVDDALEMLRGFDGQISKNKALADEAIKRLPGINATIQQAVGNNSETLFIIGSVSDDYNDALGTFSRLEAVVSRLEGMSGSLPVAPADLLKDATKLKGDVQDLKTQAVATVSNVAAERANAEGQRDKAAETLMGGTGAYVNAKHTRDAVGETLLVINNLLSMIGKPGSVEEERLGELEQSISSARDQVNQQLRPRLQDLEEKEAGQRARLSGLNLDIDMILDDIRNLEDIHANIPKGCFNTPPIEKP